MRTGAHPFTSHVFAQGPGLTSLPPSATPFSPATTLVPALGGHRVLHQSLLTVVKAKSSGC